LIHDPGPAFRALHRPGDPFVLANAWDAGSARLLAALGAEAIGTTSAGFAFTRGLPDGARVTRDEALAHAQDLVAATPLPVSADLENGYADDPEGVAGTVRLACEAGLAGLSIEDTALPGTGSYPFDLAVERVRAAASAARALPRDLVVVARADGVMTGAYDLAEGVRRLQAFEAAGADGLFLPVPPDMEAVRLICRSLSRPVNALASGRFAGVTRAEFAAAGVARISLGGALARVGQRAVVEAAQAIFGAGSFAALAKAAEGGGEAGINALLARGASPGAPA
jgi:2-methylisocitrate lyase-like PEP mutase family enzyme